MVAGFRIPAQTRHAGSDSPARTRSWTGSLGWRSPQPRHMTSRVVPCISITRPGSLPAFWCRPSMFWVTNVSRRPLRSRSTSAPWPTVGLGVPQGRSEASLPGATAQVGVRDVGLQRRRLLGLGVLGPDAFGPTKVRDTRLGRDPRAGQDDDAPGLLDQGVPGRPATSSTSAMVARRTGIRCPGDDVPSPRSKSSTRPTPSCGSDGRRRRCSPRDAAQATVSSSPSARRPT